MDTDDITVLMIANEGESMIPIGRWKAPIERLLASGHLARRMSAGDPAGQANCVITALGRKAVEEYEAETDKGLGRLIEKSSETGAAQLRARVYIENAVKLIVEATKVSAPVTGDSVQAAARNWLAAVERKVLAQLK